MKNNKNSVQKNLKLEKKIQEEIQRRVLKEEQTLEEEHIHTEDLIEALKKVTDVPHQEIDQIASSVRTNMNRQFEQKNKFLKGIIIASVISFIAILFLCGLMYKKYMNISQISYTAVFTSQVSEDREPLDDLKQVSIDIEKIHIFVRWKNLPVGKHNYRIKVFDGENSIAWDSKWEFVSNESTYSTWSTYNPKQNIDKPGKWKFEIYLEEHKVVEEYLLVVQKE